MSIRVVNGSESLFVETIDEAEKIAENEGLDLKKVAENVYKLVDEGKEEYRRNKAVKKQKKQQEKELQLTVGIGDADFERKMRDVKKWLDAGCRVRIIIKLRGREWTLNSWKTLTDRVVDSINVPVKISKPSETSHNVIINIV